MKPLLLCLAANARAVGWVAVACLTLASVGVLLDADVRAALETWAFWQGFFATTNVLIVGWLLSRLLTRDEPPPPPPPPRPESRKAALRRVTIPRPDTP